MQELATWKSHGIPPCWVGLMQNNQGQPSSATHNQIISLSNGTIAISNDSNRAVERPGSPPPQIARRGYSPGRHTNRSEEHTSELQSLRHLVCRLLLEKK